MIRSSVNGENHISHTACLTTIKLLETGTIHYRKLSDESWIFYIQYYVNS